MCVINLQGVAINISDVHINVLKLAQLQRWVWQL